MELDWSTWNEGMDGDDPDMRDNDDDMRDNDDDMMMRTRGKWGVAMYNIIWFVVWYDVMYDVKNDIDMI